MTEITAPEVRRRSAMVSRFDHPTIRYVIKRIAGAVVVLLAISLLTFLFIYFAPGGPEVAVGGEFSTPEERAVIRENLGLDDPVIAQYGRFLLDAIQLDFGSSIKTREPVWDAVASRGLVTGPLILIAFPITWLLGVTLGSVAAYRRGRAADRAAVGVGTLGASAPPFATGVVLLYVFGLQLGWLPTSGEGRGFFDRVEHLVLPAVTLSLVGVAAMLRITRAKMATVLSEDHIAFARARGLDERLIFRGAVLRNAGIHLLTESGIILLSMMSATIVVEATFGLEGVGSFLASAVTNRDIPVIQGVTLLVAAIVLGLNLVVDLLYALVDPRVSL